MIDPRAIAVAILINVLFWSSWMLYELKKEIWRPQPVKQCVVKPRVLL